MKKNLPLAFVLSFVLCLLCSISFAQTPQGMNYQAVARNASGAVLQNQAVQLRFSIHKATAGGTVIYQETDTATTNQFGLFTSVIGNGTVVTGLFDTIAWGASLKFLQVEIDITGGTNYVDMGTSQLMSVPYALNAGNTHWNKSGNDISNANAGNVGIGTSSPIANLHLSVNGTNGYAGMAITSTLSGGKTLTVNQGTAGKLNFTEPFVRDLVTMDFNTGNVGIGTTGPLATLDVVGNVKINDGTQGFGNVLTSDSFGVAHWQAPSGGLIGRTSGLISSPSPGATTEAWLGEVGNGATNTDQTVFIGYHAGDSVTGNAQKANFIGYYAGFGASNAYNANFIGVNAGDHATNADKSNFIGHRAGDHATSASYANFIGRYAGYQAVYSYNSNFIGEQAGYNATNAYQSNFIGTQAGYGATNANRSIFIGQSAGYNDVVNNTANGHSIAIGDYSGTGGFSNSIALGTGAINTATNQLFVANDITALHLNLNTGANGSVLTNDGNGNASWVASPTYTIGLHPELGGYVFRISADGKHGLVAETIDQGGFTAWYDAQNVISDPANHSTSGQVFSDWRLPTKYELNEMYGQAGSIGGFGGSLYWSSTESDSTNGWRQSMVTGQQSSTGKIANNVLRSVRAF